MRKIIAPLCFVLALLALFVVGTQPSSYPQLLKGAAHAQGGPFMLGPGFGYSGGASIGTPTSLGSTTNNSANTSSCTVTTTANITANNFVGFWIVTGQDVSVSSVSDGTNSYTQATHITWDSSTFVADFWYKAGASAVSSSASLTATLSGTTSGGWGYACAAAQASGVATSSPLDTNVNNTTSTSTPSVSTGTLAQANEIIFDWFTQGLTSTSYTESSNFTNLFNLAPSRFNLAVGYKIVSSTSSVTASPSWGSTPNAGQSSAVTSFK